MTFISLGVLSADSLPFLMVSFSLLVWLSIISTLENEEIISGDELFCFLKNLFLLLAAILFTEVTELTSTAILYQMKCTLKAASCVQQWPAAAVWERTQRLNTQKGIFWAITSLGMS